MEMVAETFAQFGGHPALAGIVAVEEPNAADSGRLDASLSLSRQILERVRRDRLDVDTPLLLSPDRWARPAAAAALRQAAGDDVVMVLHSYEPWAYTHQAPGDGVALHEPSEDLAAYTTLSGDWAALEFGAVRHAPNPEAYLQSRIRRWEAAGANWAAFRWSSGWDAYEAQEGAMTLSEDARLLPLLRQGFAANRRRPA